MSLALQSYKIRGLELPNKVVLAPMCTWLADESANEPNDRHFVHYANIAMGGVGLIITEASPVEFRGRIDCKDVGIWADRQVAGYRRLTDFVHKHTEAKIGIQLGHCGRKGNVRGTMGPHARQVGPSDEFGAKSIAPSAIAYSGPEGPYMTPAAATVADLEAIKEAFVQGAKRSVEAGFDVIEVHSAHGYLLCSFTSPLSNNRTDKYGGSLENRCRFPLEVVAAVRAAIPSTMPLFVRISGTEWVEGGLSVEDNIYYSKELMKAGADMIHVSSGGNHRDQQFPEGDHFQLPLAARIRTEANVPVIAVGDITDLSHAAKLIDSKEADLVAVGRAMLANPYWLRNEAARLGLENSFCPRYQSAAYGSARKGAVKMRGVNDDESLPSATIQEMKVTGGMKSGIFICCGGQSATTEAELVN